MVLNTKFWSFPVHTYQKQCFLMIISAVRGRGTNLVIDKDFIVKKWKFENFDQNSCYIPQKKAKNMQNSDLVWKIMICNKKLEKNNFQNFFFKGGTLWCRNGQKTFFRFFKFSKFFFEKWPQWDITNIERNKVMKYELNRSVHWCVTWYILPGGVRWTPPPCRIGLKGLIP